MLRSPACPGNLYSVGRNDKVGKKMVYIKRNEKGEIAAILAENSEDNLEKKDLDDPEIMEFFTRCDDQKWELLQSDIDLIRVIEDLVEILMEKNIITITDFPVAAIEKLVSRRGVRNQLSNAGGIVNDDEDDSYDV